MLITLNKPELPYSVLLLCDAQCVKYVQAGEGLQLTALSFHACILLKFITPTILT